MVLRLGHRGACLCSLRLRILIDTIQRVKIRSKKMIPKPKSFPPHIDHFLPGNYIKNTFSHSVVFKIVMGSIHSKRGAESGCRGGVYR